MQAERVLAPVVPVQGRRLRIVDERDAPVRGAEVACEVASMVRSAEELVTADVEARLAAAPRCSSDGDGFVTLPIAAPIALVIARAGARFGQRVIQFDDPLEGTPTLRLQPDRSLRVVVVGPDGNPRSGVPVEVTYRHGEGLVDSGEETFRASRSDPQGIVTLSHLQTLPFWAGCDPAVDLKPVVLATAASPMHVLLVEPHPGPVNLSCPAHGSIRVRAWIACGIPNCMELKPAVGIVEDQGGRTVESLLADGAAPAEWCVSPVAPGHRWSLGAWPFATVTVDGPMRDGEEVQVDLTAEEGCIGLSMWLVNPDGGACARQVVRVPRLFGQEGHTGADGRLSMIVPRDEDALELIVPALGSSATLAVPRADSATAFLNAGVVVLQQMPVVGLPQLIAEGSVVDAATGLPVRATVTASEKENGKARATADATSDGSFELRGDTGDTIWVYARSSGYRETGLQVARGGHVVLALHPEPSLRATVLVDDGVSVESLGLFLRDGDEVMEPCRIEAAPGRITGLFRLHANDLALEVASARFGKGTGIWLSTPAGAGPPLLARAAESQWQRVEGGFSVVCDLRGQLDQIVVSLGRRKDSGWLLLRSTSSQSRYAILPLAQRTWVAVARGTGLEAIAYPWRYCALKTFLVRGENTIELQEPAKVLFEMKGWPVGISRARLTLGIRVLQYRDALSAEVDTALGREARTSPSSMPRTETELAALDQAFDVDTPMRVRADCDSASMSLNRLGTYVVVPYVGGYEPLLDAAVQIEITAPAQTVAATIQFDPEIVRRVSR